MALKRVQGKERLRAPSRQQLVLLKHLLAARAQKQHGYSLMKATGLGPGTLYTLLKRLHGERCLYKTTEIVEGRCRISYQLTEKGLRYAERTLEQDVYERGAAKMAET